MDLTDTERNALTTALAARRAEQDLSRRLRQEARAERQRLAEADQAEQERFARALLTFAGIEAADVDRRREGTTASARAFLEQQRRVAVGRAGAVAERNRTLARVRGEALVAEQQSGAAGPSTLTTLDTAVAIWTVHSGPDANNHVTVQLDPPAAMRNVANVYQSKQASPDIRFHIPGFWIVDVHWAFRIPIAGNVLLNAITFVQALGVDSLFASGWFLGDSFAEIEFFTRLDLFAVDPPPLQQIHAIGTGDQDQGPVRYLHSDWWDLLGQFDSTVYDFQSTLIDRSFSRVGAGSTVFAVVTASIVLSADGNAFCVADSDSGDLEINVPAVYVSTFSDNPIP
jgi:hypothetical protein